ncbi:uncharacterized protein [Sinocyclocheilus grahami]|uniref:uncharacterized protein n=1 Tax=Sinocyclocheilus grahami TaxID=75366 RepID=UPI0007AC5A47|nr:PREDICTED: uncharacterized protein LOC107552601 [Sinocyclocheilus grahami]
MYQCPGGFKNMDSTPHMVSHPSTTVTEINSVIANKESGALLAKEIIQEKTLGPIMNNTTLPLPTSEEALFRSSPNHLGKHFALKPHMDCSQYQSVTAKAMMPPDKPQIGEAEPKQQTMLQYPTESLIKALTSLGLSLEDLELLSHCPENQLTTENLPFIIKDIQQRKGTKDIKYGHARCISSDQVGESSYTHGEQRNPRIINGEWQESHSQRSLSPERCRSSKVIYKHFSTQSRTLRTRHSSGRGSNSFLKRLQHEPAEVTGWRPGSVYFPPRSKRSISHSFVSLDCNKAIHYTTQRPLSSPHRSNTYNAMTKSHQQSSFPVKSAKSEVTAESINIQMPVTKTTAKTLAQTVSFGRCRPTRNTDGY